jgi:hypothetical protein
VKKDIARRAYKSILDFDVFHQYFTSIRGNDGATIDLIPYIESGANNPYAFLSRDYNAQRFIRIVPDTATQAVLDQHHLRVEVTATGLRVVAEVTDVRRADGSIEELVALTPVALGTSFTFLWYITDPFYFQYTGLPHIPALLKPSAANPKGMYFKLNTEDLYLFDGARNFDNKPFGQLSAAPVGWTGPEATPLLALTIMHRTNAPFYQTGAYRPHPQPIRYKTVFGQSSA